MNERLKFVLLRFTPSAIWRWRLMLRYQNEIAYFGEPELPELPRLVEQGQLCLDIGANEGVYSYALGQLTGNVIAFEPNPVMATILRRAALSGVSVQPIALSSRDGEAELVVPRMYGGHGLGSLKQGLHDGVEGRHMRVRTARLDKLGLTGVAFIKLDVEGFEEEVLAGASDTIRRDRPTMLIEIEEQHNVGGTARVMQFLCTELGYTALFFWEGRWREFKEFDVTTHQDTSNLFGTRRAARYANNFLFLPTAAQAEALL